MSFLKSLFGGGKSSGAAKVNAPLGEETHKGFLIKAIEMRVGSEYQLSGTIEKEIGGELKTYSFVRADRLSSREDATTMAINKGRLIIDEQGDKLFQ
jgi:hypothetical protein